MLAPVIHILPLTRIRRERLLPVKGRVIARLDQKVNPFDVIAEATFGQHHLIIDVAQVLGVRSDVAQKSIQVKAGDTLTANELIGQRSGFSPRMVRTPQAGRVVLTGAGKVLLEVGDPTFELRAGLPGVVTRIIPERGVEISFGGLLVQGVWGNGRVDQGILQPLLSTPEDVLTVEQMDVNLRGSIVLAGHCSDAKVIKAASELPLRGLILGSMLPALIPQAMQASFPIMLIDGFGKLPLDSATYRLLTTSAQRELTLNTQPLDLHAGIRPEIYISLPLGSELPASREMETFTPDQQVRLKRAPYPGAIGTLLSLRPGLTTLPGGIRAPAADVRLEMGEQLTIPLANLEVLG